MLEYSRDDSPYKTGPLVHAGDYNGTLYVIYELKGTPCVHCRTLILNGHILHSSINIIDILCNLMGSYLFVGNPENPEGIYNTNVYCKQTANFFEDQDWLSFWELTYGEGIPSQVIMNQTIMVIFEDGIKLWKPHGHLAAVGDFREKEWSEKITIDNKLRTQADWKLARLSDCGRHLLSPLKGDSFFALTGTVNLEAGKIDDLTKIKLPKKGHYNCNLISEYGIFIEQEGIIFFTSKKAKIWHPITMSKIRIWQESMFRNGVRN